jgi:predicted dehydrogenase
MDDKQKKVRFGVLSTARIGTDKVIPAIQKASMASVTAIASRSGTKAEAAANELGISHTYSSYEELLKDDDVDAVYIPLPNHLHIPWTIRALEAGKHVLCEKPLGLSAGEVETLIDVARSYPDLHVREAFMYKYHPRWIKTLQLIRSGAIGQLKTIHGHFSYRNLDPENIRNQPDMGGGGVMDVGCYPISVSRMLFGCEPIRIDARLETDPELGVDIFASALLEFEGGSTLFTCGTQMVRSQHIKIWGETGLIEMELPFNPPTDKPTRLLLNNESGTEEFHFETCNQFTRQADDFARALFSRINRTDKWLTDAKRNMAVIEKVLRRD